MPVMDCETLPWEDNPVIRNTSAVNKFNGEKFLNTLNHGIEGLYNCLKSNEFNQSEEPSSNNLVPASNHFITDDFKINRDIAKTQWKYCGDRITLDSSLQKAGLVKKDVKEFSQSIKNISESLNKTSSKIDKKSFQTINNAFEIFQKSIGLKTETEEDRFVSKYFLQESINKANRLIYELFGTIKTESELYIDPEEPEYKFFNITIKPENVSENSIDSLLDKFDELQDRFIETAEQTFSSKITFHIEIV